MTRVVLLLTLVACERLDEHTVLVDGHTRTYALYVPDGLTGPAPLVMAFHGGGPDIGGKHHKLEREADLSARADAHGFVVAYPAGYGGMWDDRREIAPSYADGLDDLAFVDAVIADVQSRVDVDPARIYATGISNGGLFSERLACERSETFAAVAVVAATIPANQLAVCAPTAPVAQLYLPGTADPLVPYEGGTIAKDRGEAASVDDMIAFWVAHDGCGEPIATSDLPDTEDDGTITRRSVWTCTGAAVELLEVEGGGHAWPGGRQYLPKAVIGPVARDFEAADEIWRFFAANPNPETPGSRPHPRRSEADMRVAVVGGGFVGLEAALAAKEAGYDVTVLERGDVAASVAEWGSVRMFTPWSMLTTTAGRAAVGAAGLDDEAACPTGAEVRDRYLLPLAATLDVRTHHRVRGIGRLRHRKGDAIAEVRRQHDPFHLVVDTPDGPAVFVADAVLDCSGTWTDPVPAGLGGVAAAGEAALADAGLVRYGPRTDGLSGRVLVTGDGASGATAVVALAGVADVTWLTPGPDAPRFVSPPDDPLPARAALLHAAVDALHHVHHVAGRFIVALRRDGDGLHATLNDGTTLSADALVVCNGLRPDLSLHRELQVHQCYASEGTMKLAAALLGGSGDCLAEKAAGPDLLRNPEPGFFVLGSKSYGRRSDFLVRDGQRQAREVLTLLAEIA